MDSIGQIIAANPQRVRVPEVPLTLEQLTQAPSPDPLPDLPRLVRMAGMPEKYAREAYQACERRFEHAPARRAFEAFLERVNEHAEEGFWLYLVGHVGVGKTSAMVRLLSRLRLAWCPLPPGHIDPGRIRYRLATDMAEDLLEVGQSKEARGLPPDMAANVRSRVLLVDDLDRMRSMAGYQGGEACNRWDTFTEQRDGHGLTVVSANWSEEQLRGDPYFLRGLDRARERGLVITIAGESMRGRCG